MSHRMNKINCRKFLSFYFSNGWYCKYVDQCIFKVSKADLILIFTKKVLSLSHSKLALVTIGATPTIVTI